MIEFINYNWFGSIADHCLDETPEFYSSVGVSKLHSKSLDPEKVESGDVVFVKTDYVFNGVFQKYFLPRIKNKFTLITGVSSYQVSKGYDISGLLESSKIIRWYCTNAPAHHKVVPLPIGFEEKERDGGDQDVLKLARDNRKPREDKKNKLLLPYHTLSTNPQRSELFYYLKSLPFVETQEDKLPFEAYLRLLNDYKFVICLEGSGPDVHRNYEALLVDTVPINIKNLIEDLFTYYNLPGEFLNSWTDLVEDYFEKMITCSYNMEPSERFLTIQYHTEKIRGTYEN